MFRGKSGWALGAAALGLVVAAPASAQNSNGAQIIRSIGLADLQQFVLLRGDSVVDTGKNGAISVLAKTKSGISYWLVGEACRQPGVVGCEGLFMQVRYTLAPTVTDATLSNANSAYAALKTFKDAPNKTIGVSRYIVLRGGVTRQNVVENIGILVGLAPRASQIASGKAPPAAQPK
jgi:hypothetical protein